MDLILWRHAEAEEGEDDMKRALTPKGRRQAARMAQWLKAHVPPPWTVYASPAVRTQETVDALHMPFMTLDACRPGTAPEAVLAAAGWPHAVGSVIVVGHQPTLGMAGALALTGQPQPWSLRKGAVAWLSSRERQGALASVQLRAYLSPELVND